MQRRLTRVQPVQTSEGGESGSSGRAAVCGVRYSIVNSAADIQSNLDGFGHDLEGCRYHDLNNLFCACSS